MPPGTPPARVPGASKTLHGRSWLCSTATPWCCIPMSPTPCPPDHQVLRYQGTRLRIQKATLRHWRRRFAQQLEARGVPANAAERAVRGKTLAGKSDGVFRTGQRQESRRILALVDSVARDGLNGHETPEPGRLRVLLLVKQWRRRGWPRASRSKFRDIPTWLLKCEVSWRSCRA